MTNDQIKIFLQGGKATFTIESAKTGVHYTFKAIKARSTSNSSTLLWVSLLTAPDTYTYLGSVKIIKDNWYYVITRKSMPANNLHKVFGWFINLLDKDATNKDLIFRHSGRCSRCHRELTTPTSIDAGMGPTCLKKIA